MNVPRTIVPPIKCQGIKTKLVRWISVIVPDDFKGRWVEPFMGSGVVAFNIRPRKALLADSNPYLIDFYKAIAKKSVTPNRARDFLEMEGAKLLRSNGQHFYEVRERFNHRSDPLDFLFLNRACFNGVIRFNRKGKFNVPFCQKPNRFAQAYVTKICNQIKSVADAITLGNYEFRCQDYSLTVAEVEDCDLLYCDPPYVGRHADYFNGWDEEHEHSLADSLGNTSARFILSTWHSNKYRSNQFIGSIWSQYQILTREHFYHVGAREDNRNSMLEALVTNFPTSCKENKPIKAVQLELLNKSATYGG
jgi:DNA adenine methylase